MKTQTKTEPQAKKSIMENRGFAVLLLCFGILGLLLVMHHIISYEAVLRPHMEYLMEHKVITNDISGITFLRMFTVQSNVLVDIYLILFAIGIFGNKRLYSFTHNEWLRGAITLNIAITGIIYFTVLLPFSDSFPWEKGIWFSNIINIWNHLITPVFFTALWFVPIAYKKIPKVKYALFHLIYPICYFIMCVILGAKDGFYPYPFLNGKQMWDLLFKAKEYDSLKGTLIVFAAVVILSGLFFGISCGLGGIHNKMLKKDKYKDNVS